MQGVHDAHPLPVSRTSRGAGGGCSPSNIWAVRFFWAMTKIWAEGPGRGFWREKIFSSDKKILSSHLRPV